MKIANPYLLLFAIVSLVVTSCQKANDPTDITKTPTDTTKDTVKTKPVDPPKDTVKMPIPVVVITEDVYVSGALFNGFAKTAVYWKNGALTKLSSPGEETIANAIFIKNQDIYLAGTATINGEDKAIYWKNGNMVVLGDGGAYDIAVQDNDVYVAGYTNLPRDIYFIHSAVATFWKNGTPTKLTDPAQEMSGGVPDSYAQSIAVKDNDVHVAGWGNSTYAGGAAIALYWKNSVPKVLSPNGSAWAYGIWLDGTDVYIAGSVIHSDSPLSLPGILSGAVYWKNEQGKNLFSGSLYSEASCIAVDDGNVYIAGPNGDANAAYCIKNDTESLLVMNGYTPRTSGITTYNGNIYISGYTTKSAYGVSGAAGYWKNYQPVILAGASAKATDIVVLKH